MREPDARWMSAKFSSLRNGGNTPVHGLIHAWPVCLIGEACWAAKLNAPESDEPASAVLNSSPVLLTAAAMDCCNATNCYAQSAISRMCAINSIETRSNEMHIAVRSCDFSGTGLRDAAPSRICAQPSAAGLH